MSDAPRPYSPVYIQSWTVLSVVLGLLLLSMFLFGDAYLSVGQVTWALLRWLASPLI